MNIRKVIDKALTEAKDNVEKTLAGSKDVSDEDRVVAMSETHKAIDTAHREANKALDEVSVNLRKMFEREA
jgi:hypothetical protein